MILHLDPPLQFCLTCYENYNIIDIKLKIGTIEQFLIMSLFITHFINTEVNIKIIFLNVF